MEGTDPESPIIRRGLSPSHYYGIENMHHGEHHLEGSSQSLKVIIFGGLDGILTMFAVVSGCFGASVSPRQILGLSIGSLLASAFSMGYGEYVSSRAEKDYVDSEKRREEMEIEFYPEVEKKEMFDIYTNRYQFTTADANSLVDLGFRRKEFFLRHMMVEELGILLEEDEITPLRKSILMYLSFCLLGSFPLLGFLGFLIPDTSASRKSILCFSLTTFFSILGAAALGYYKGIYTKQSKLKSALMMTANGIIVVRLLTPSA
ncbi:integral membrane protein domain-containing protein [Theileria equi strain WA]|uniref:Integral membrane protein domain-containing protein n=1 Tax=Theileria equi strain WA TaxID=1537102 RepID=L0B076_THEEQ|nr:integral membrane protein domain-containing protein [Theileria equi strain WA]AFZ81225.1 integral membrane protein domain-containing protein [Theileria equi strain WA]|eukprot:XP_004830891.1 integral membrane protein domain-containing protein [Theileria equi strain WA]